MDGATKEVTAADDDQVDGIIDEIVAANCDHQQVAVVAVTVPRESQDTTSGTIVIIAAVLLVAFVEASLVDAVSTGGSVSTSVLHSTLAASADMPATYMPR